MYRLLQIFTCFLCFNGGALASSWSHKTLYLDSGGDYVSLFNAELELYRFPSMEKTLLESKHIDLDLVLSGKATGSVFPTELLHAFVYEGGKLEHIELISRPLTVKEARELIVSFRLPKRLSIKEERAFFSSIENEKNIGQTEISKLKLPFHSQGGGKELRTSCWLEQRYASDTPIVARWNISWRRMRGYKEKAHYDVPIPTPQGFEHIDLSAPDTFGPDSIIDGDSALVVRHRNMEALPQQVNSGEIRKKDDLEQITVKGEPKDNGSWWGLKGALVALATLLLGYFKSRKAK